MAYLIHFNRQHDPKTGKFIFGDGDGDGIANDHAHQKEYVTSSRRKDRVYKERPTQKNKVTSSSRNRTYKEKPLSKTESKFTRVGTGKVGTISNTLAKTESLFTHVGSGKVSSISSSTISNGQTSVNHYLSAIGGTTPINQLVNDPRKHLELDPTNPDYQWEQDYAKQEKTTLNDLGTETWKRSFDKNSNPSTTGKKKVNLSSTNPNYEYEKDYAKQEKTTLNDLGIEVWKKSLSKKK